MDSQTFYALVDKFLEGRASLQEEQMLLNFLGSFQDCDQWNALELGDRKVIEDLLWEKIRSKTMQSKLPETTIKHLWMDRFLRRGKWMIAASLLLAIVGIYFVMRVGKRPQPQIAQATIEQDALPGKNGAILTLANGRNIVLDSLQNGVIAQQGISEIHLNDGRLEYNKSKNATANNEVTYNSVSTPNGRQYQLILPDGTKVWLNAASNIKYPTAFTGNERKIEMNGEAYFEIAHNEKQPFKIKINANGEVQVLGTNLNINAYKDGDAIKTTLLKGSVKFVSSKTVLLKPGEQAVAPRHTSNSSSDVFVRSNVDMSEVMAWKNGYFQFKNADLRTVLRELSRWYDLEVVYEGNIPPLRFEGELPRTAMASQVLQVLKKNMVNFRIEDKKLIVFP